MKSFLAKISLRKFVGLSLGEHEVSVSEMAVTPLGTVEISHRTEPCPPNELPNVIEQVLQSLRGKKQRRRLQVSMGVPNSRLFFSARPLLRGSTDPSPEEVLQKVLCSSNISVDDLTTDMIKASISKVPVASVAACRKKYMAAVLGALQRCGANAVRTEPAACALVRAATQAHRPPRRAKTILRIFLGADEGMAVLTAGGMPLAWRSFALSAYSEGMAILSAARTLLSQSQHHGIELSLDFAIVYGRADLHQQLQKDGLPTEIGTRMLWHEDPGLDGESIARGLALGCSNVGGPSFDLSRRMKPRAMLRDIFPWAELACECVLVIVMALILARQSDKASAACTAVTIQCNDDRVLGASNAGQLEKEKRELTKKLDGLHQFLGSRVVWTAVVRDVTNNLPNNIHLLQMQGSAAMGGKKGAKKTLQLVATTPLTAEGAVPPEVDKFLGSLRDNKRMQQDFPRIELTGVRPSDARNNEKASAGFTIVCQPGSVTAGGGRK